MIISFLTQNGGGGGVDPSVLSGYANAIAYDETTHYIQLLNDDTVLSQFDASAFIIDGMVENVYISGTNLVIDFNTESGKQDIEIPLSDIFDPSNYYTSAQVDAIVSGLNDDIDAVELDIVAIEAELDDKLDASAYTPTDLSNYYTKSEVDGIASGKVDTTEYSEDQLTIAQALNDLNNRKLDASAYTPTDLSEYYTSAQTNALLADKQDTLVSGTNIKTINNESILGSGNIVIQGGGGDVTSAQVQTMIDSSISGKADTTALTAVDSVVTAHTADTSIHTDASEKAIWNAKLDASALNDYYTSAQTDAAIQSAVSGKMDDDRLVVLTQQEYDDLQVKDPDTLYVISDDNVLDAYMTSAQTEAAIQEAVSGKAETTALTQVASQVSSKADSSTVTALNNVVTAHTADTSIHTTANEKQTWSNKQDALISGTNIKTINGESILGSGNITISGGGDVTSAQVQTMIDQSISGKVDTTDWESAELTITQALFELKNDKLDASALQNYYTSGQTVQAIAYALQDYYTSTQTEDAIQTAVNGIFSYDSSTSALTITTI